MAWARVGSFHSNISLQHAHLSIGKYLLVCVISLANGYFNARETSSYINGSCGKKNGSWVKL